MTLQKTGAISLHEIGAELGMSAPYDLRAMAAAAGMGTPDSIDEFYGFTKAVITNNGASTLYFNRIGVPVTTNAINVTSTVAFTVTTSGAISTAYVDPTSASAGTVNIYFECGSTNNSGSNKTNYVYFYDGYGVVRRTVTIVQLTTL